MVFYCKNSTLLIMNFQFNIRAIKYENKTNAWIESLIQWDTNYSQCGCVVMECILYSEVL